MALPKVHRLRHRHDFNTVYRKGTRRTTRHLTLRALCQPEAKSFGVVQEGVEIERLQAKPLRTQIGISVSSKVSKRAVVRNRIRRQIQAAFGHLLPELRSGWQLVVVVHPQAIQCDYHQFLQELKQLLAEAEVFDGNS